MFVKDFGATERGLIFTFGNEDGTCEVRFLCWKVTTNIGPKVFMALFALCVRLRYYARSVLVSFGIVPNFATLKLLFQR